MKINALKGMKDILPKEQRLRDYVQKMILETYRASGFERISTPMLEDAENLDKSEGGDNLNLIFKVLKRGEKLASALDAENVDEKSLSDMGLRYDLTLPLTRFYSAHRNELPNPFKVIQTDRVFRAERPQRGRSREFVQCDIDIIGDKSCNAEVELIDVTARAILSLNFMQFTDYLTIKINDRKILRNMLETMGFPKESLDSVCITFDKLDKIDIEGVKKELEEKNMPEKAIKTLVNFFMDIPASIRDNNKLEYQYSLNDVLPYCSDPSILNDIKYIIDTVNKISDNKYRIQYCPTLVRGQGYYTGVVFEIQCSGLNFDSAIGGGGRYDNLIGKFTNETIPAVGFSIGFERLCMILSENNYEIPVEKEKIALIYNDNDSFYNVITDAGNLRKKNYSVSIIKKAKNPAHQYDMLKSQGYSQAVMYGSDGTLIFKQIQPRESE